MGLAIADGEEPLPWNDAFVNEVLKVSLLSILLFLPPSFRFSLSRVRLLRRLPVLLL
jgi:hypothetical protein